MTAEFDPYAEWLLIPAGLRPPTHYDLLGLPAFEAAAEQIHRAAMARMALVRRYQLGRHAEEALRLQTEISRAFDCLKTREEKERYDAALREHRIALQPSHAQRGQVSRNEVTVDALTPPIVAPPVIVAPRSSSRPTQVPVPASRPPALPNSIPHALRFRNTTWVAAAAIGTAFVVLSLMVCFRFTDGGPTTLATKSPTTTDDAGRTKPKRSAEPMPLDLLPSTEFDKSDANEPPPSLPALPDNQVVPDPSSDQDPTTNPPGTNLLGLIDPSRAIEGNWTSANGELIGEGSWGRIPIPVSPPREYQLDILATRLSAGGGLALGLVMDGKSFVALVDGVHDWYKGGAIAISGIDMVDGNTVGANDSTREGSIFERDTPTSLRCVVSPGALRVTFGTLTVIDWQGDSGRLSTRPEWNVPDEYKNQLFIGTYCGTFRVSKLDLRPSLAGAEGALAGGNSSLPSGGVAASPPTTAPQTESPPQPQQPGPRPDSRPQRPPAPASVANGGTTGQRQRIPSEEQQQAVAYRLSGYTRGFESFPNAATRSMAITSLLGVDKWASAEPALVYLALQRARALAQYAGDVKSALDAADRLDQSFAVDGWALRVDVMRRMAPAPAVGGLSATNTSFESTLLSLIDEAVAAGRNDAARQLGIVAAQVAKALSDPELRKKLKQKAKEMTKLPRKGTASRPDDVK